MDIKKKICVITGSRAEYGLLRPLLEEIKTDTDLKLQLIVTGMHLSPEFGLTYQEIQKDGFDIDEKIDISLISDKPAGISKSISLAITGFVKCYGRLKPELIVVLGDRFEIFGAVVAALVSRIPVAHIHGGELTEGVFDDTLRHCITKMCHVHFTSTQEYRKRIIQLGEDPVRVFNVGAIGLENIKGLRLLSKKALEKELDFKFSKYNLLVTFHPLTLEDNTSGIQFQELLDALDELKDTKIIFTKANADPDGRVINKMIDKYVSKNPDKATAFVSMGRLKYLSTIRVVDAVVGNSSSGIIEASSFRVPTINIGDRQKGRVRPRSVIDCKPEKKEIKKAFDTVLLQKFKNTIKCVKNPYEKRNAAMNIKNIIKDFCADSKAILKKDFFNIRHKF